VRHQTKNNNRGDHKQAAEIVSGNRVLQVCAGPAGMRRSTGQGCVNIQDPL